MKFLSSMAILFAVCLSLLSANRSKCSKSIPVVVVTWNYTNATQTAWNMLYKEKQSALNAIEKGCSECERLQCRKTVGFGGSPDESGETTLDAMIIDGVRMDVGAVGGLRNIKSAISVARKVLDNTKHTLLGGELATQFAVQMGFTVESLQTSESKEMWTRWKANNCQPNFWKNVIPEPTHSCGPYRPITPKSSCQMESKKKDSGEDNHDTIGMLAIDIKGHIAAGTSTNGARNKIPGRIGDSPIPGAGAYADQDVGAAAGTGDGDIMMRFLPSFLVVEEMRRGASPISAADTAVRRIARHYPKFFGAIIALNKTGHFGAACNGMAHFPFYVSSPLVGEPTLNTVSCIKPL